MTFSHASRYVAVSRRAALTGAFGAGLLALAACSDDASTLPSTATGSSSAPAPSPSGATSPSTSAASCPTASSGTALPAGAALTVSFTFASSSGGGPSRNPYVAVWIENAAGELVRTVALWHEDRGGQDRWLGEMRAYSALGAGDAQTVSSATRQPGSYQVVWDGSTLEGGRATAGMYRLFVEAAREHGPYELIQTDVALGSKAATFTLMPNGELTAASAAYAV